MTKTQSTLRTVLPMRRRLLGLLMLSAAAPTMLSGCGPSEKDEAKPLSHSAGNGTGTSDKTTESSDLWQTIASRKTIRIGTEGTWAPWCFHTADGKLTGFDVELGRLIARELGLEAVFVEGRWDGLLAGLDAGRWDLMINGVDRTPEREKAFAFSEPYAYNRTAVIVRADDERIRSLSDLKGLHTANTISSTYAAIAEAQGAVVSGVDDLQQTFELLLSGRIDATLNAEAAFVDFKRAHPEAPVKIAAFAPESMPVAIAMKSGETTRTLQTKVDDVLVRLHESGELAELSRRFFGADITRKPSP